jgi:microcystin-dependent protein
MADPFVAEIRIFPFNFAPKGWAFCDGQILPISQNTALFSLLGTTYGGDGKSTFALPNLQGRAPMHPGQGPGLSLHDLGESSGVDFVTLLESEVPGHSHPMRAHNADQADAQNPSPNTSLTQSANGFAYQDNTSQNLVQLNPSALAPAGSDQPHNNMMPYLTHRPAGCLPAAYLIFDHPACQMARRICTHYFKYYS